MVKEETKDSEDLEEVERLEIPEILPLLPVRDIVIFPYMIMPLFVGREGSILAVDEALSHDRLIFLCAQKDVSTENPVKDDIYSVGTIGMVMRMLKLPDGRIKILVQGLAKGRIKKYQQEKPLFLVKVEKVAETHISEVTLEVEAVMRNVKEQLEKVASLGKIISPEIMMILDSITEPGRLADLVASNLGLKVEESQEILEEPSPIERLKKVGDFLQKELEVLTMQVKIQSQAKEEMSKTQREYFLREQLRAIKNELGDTDEDVKEVEELRENIKKSRMPATVEKEALKQLKRLDQMHPEAAEASMLRTYIDWLIDTPWSKTTKDKLDIQKAKGILDEDHYDLEKVKERILEYLAVRKLKKKMKGPILCFLGPPGVGKTSLGKSIARALGRKFVRLSLGGMRDEAEIRGHRRTYVGALPGRIIQGLKTAGSNNPVFMLDEVDKLGSDFRGDPSSALLEVLDPEQNFMFADHYLNVPFDLTNVMFITTSNRIDTIPPPLRDRMEVIRISGYTHEEKLKIAKKYLIPKQLIENGIENKNVKLSDKAILKMISQYTHEAGLRNLEREIASICRKIARNLAEGRKRQVAINELNVHKYLGPPRILPEDEHEQSEVGVATGLAWTEAGGDILYIEATIMSGKGSLQLTGQLGDIMKESAQAALSYCRAHLSDKIEDDFFSTHDIHVHVPAGAIPKDGPSAGIAIATAIISAITNRPINKDVAMTGEITLRGRALPIGGLKEKSLAALRANLKTVIIPEKNKKDLDEIPKDVKNKLNYVFVKQAEEVLNAALLKADTTKEKTKKTKNSQGSKIKKKKGTRRAIEAVR
jgi:ATP-dependent Lon protease